MSLTWIHYLSVFLIALLLSMLKKLIRLTFPIDFLTQELNNMNTFFFDTLSKNNYVNLP